MLPLRSLLNMYSAQVESRSRGNRIVRESTTLRVTETVWADVASATGLGFRFGDAGPLLYGEIGGATIEGGVYESKDDGGYRTVVQAKIAGGPPGKLTVSARTATTRLLGLVTRAPEATPAALAEAYFVRADPPALAPVLLGAELVDVLVASRDREPSLEYTDGTAWVVLEGVELMQERLEALARGLGAMARADAPSPYRAAP